MDYIATQQDRALIIRAITALVDLASSEGSADSRMEATAGEKLLSRMEIANLFVPKPRAA